MKTNLNEKQLTQIESWLDGDARYKLLDCTRTAVLKLKGTLLQVWLACFMYESDDQQSWLSNAKLMELTGLSKHTVIEARRWLVQNGWLKDTGHVAAMKYDDPSQGSYTVKVFSVDDPTKGAEVAPGAKVAPRFRKGGADSARAEVAPPSAKFAPNGSAVAFASTGTTTGTDTLTSTVRSHVSESVPTGKDPSLRETKNQQQQQQNQNQNQRPSRSSYATAWLAKYDAPKPVDFNSWTVSARAVWVENHRLRPGMSPALAPSQETVTSPVQTPPPMPLSPAPTPQATVPEAKNRKPTPKIKCPACDYTRRYGYEIAEHIEAEHKELGQQSFRLECFEDGCTWAKWWNRIDNNKAEAEECIMEHLEMQHRPESPKYDPWKLCPGCGLTLRVADEQEHVNTRCSKKLLKVA